MAQFGQSARLGAVRSQVRILLPRFLYCGYRKGVRFVRVLYNLTPSSIVSKKAGDGNRTHVFSLEG